MLIEESFFYSMVHAKSIIIRNQETHTVKVKWFTCKGLSYSFFFASSKYTCADFGMTTLYVAVLIGFAGF